MQHKLDPQCIDPNLLNLNEHIPSAPLASDCFAPFDDVEIVTGQAGFDDGDVPPKTSTWINPHHPQDPVEDPDDVLADFDYRYVHREHLRCEESRVFADASV